jgi:hypothetical protein
VSDSETLSVSVVSDAQTQTTNLPLLGSLSHAGNVLRQLTVHSLSFKLAAVTVRAAVTVTVQRRLGRRLHGNPSLMMTRIMMIADSEALEAHCSLTQLQVGNSHCGPCGGHGHGPAPTRTVITWQSESHDDSDHDDLIAARAAGVRPSR